MTQNEWMQSLQNLFAMQDGSVQSQGLSGVLANLFGTANEGPDTKRIPAMSFPAGGAAVQENTRVAGVPRANFKDIGILADFLPKTGFSNDRFVDASLMGGRGTAREGMDALQFLTRLVSDYPYRRQVTANEGEPVNIGSAMELKYPKTDFQNWGQYLRMAPTINLNAAAKVGLIPEVGLMHPFYDDLKRTVGQQVNNPSELGIPKTDIELNFPYVAAAYGGSSWPFAQGDMKQALPESVESYAVQNRIKKGQPAFEPPRDPNLTPEQRRQEMRMENARAKGFGSRVLGHEMTHAFTQNMTPKYRDSLLNLFNTAMQKMEYPENSRQKLEETTKYLTGYDPEGRKRPQWEQAAPTEMITHVTDVASVVGHPMEKAVNRYEKKHGKGSFEKLTETEQNRLFDSSFDEFKKKALKSTKETPGFSPAHIRLMELMKTKEGEQLVKKALQDWAAVSTSDQPTIG